MATRWPFWKWRHWKSIGFCLWQPSTYIWILKLKFQSKLDLCSGNHVVYRQTDGRMDKVNPVYPPPTSLGGGIRSDIQYTECITMCIEVLCMLEEQCTAYYVIMSSQVLLKLDLYFLLRQQNHQTALGNTCASPLHNSSGRLPTQSCTSCKV